MPHQGPGSPEESHPFSLFTALFLDNRSYSLGTTKDDMVKPGLIGKGKGFSADDLGRTGRKFRKTVDY
jgi:hypothetical protein